MKRWHGNQWAILLTLSLGFFMTLVDLTIVNIAIPDMTRRLHTSLDAISWVLNAYVIVLAVLLITCGRLGDVFGPRNLFLGGVALFTLASAGCGVAQNAGELIAARAVQGLGAAVLLPQTMTIIITTFPPQRRGTALGIWGSVAGLATIAGPTIGGLLVTWFDWRWIFFINLPIGLIVLIAGVLLLPDTRIGRAHRLDIPGVVLASLALVTITYGLVEGQRYNWGTIASFVSIPLVFAVGGVLLALFLIGQIRTQDREPLVPFVLLRDRDHALMNIANVVVGLGMVGMFLPMTIYLQAALGFSPIKAGLTMAPASVVSMFVAPAAGRLADRGGRFVLMTGLLLYAAGMGLVLIAASPTAAWQDFLPAVIVAGLGIGCTFAPMQTIATREVPPQLAGAAAGLLNTNRQLGSVLGTAVVLAVLENRLAHAMVAQAVRRAPSLPEQVRAPFVAGFAHAGGGSGSLSPAAPPLHLPPALAAQVTRAGRQVFTSAFVDALTPTMIVPIVLIVAGAALCLWVRPGIARPSASPAAPAPADVGS